MAIQYAQLINSFVSTEGSNGFMTNYVYYTFLVVNTDGSRRIVEGQLDSVSSLFPYVRTPIDEIEEVKQTVRNLRKDINEIADQKFKYAIDTLFPIPEILNKNETEALELLEKAGLEPVFINQYPETTPKNGIILAFARNTENFKKVNVRIIHEVPEIVGLKLEDAQAKLTEAGFQADVTCRVVADREDGVVLECTRGNENDLHVALLVSSAIPETKNLPADEAKKLLEDAGYQVKLMQVIRPGTPGLVVGWENVSAGVIRLDVSLAAKYVAKSVTVQGNNLQESTGDTYSAEAEFDNKQQTLHVKLVYTIGTKVKHQLTGLEVAGTGLIPKRQFVFDREMGPNVQGFIQFQIPFKRPFEELPKELKFTLQTQYGFMKKKETVDLQATFEW